MRKDSITISPSDVGVRETYPLLKAKDTSRRGTANFYPRDVSGSSAIRAFPSCQLHSPSLALPVHSFLLIQSFSPCFIWIIKFSQKA
jgi:hypothetical protein